MSKRLMWVVTVGITMTVLAVACGDDDGSKQDAKPVEREEPETVFIDPTADVINEGDIELGNLVYVGPFATLRAQDGDDGSIKVGEESNIQDNVTINAEPGAVHLGRKSILAHGAAVIGPASIGEGGSCPEGEELCPTFVGFNSLVEGATIQKDAMVTHLARVAPGVTIPSGRKVLPGKSVDSPAEVAAETAPLTEADRAFMHGVVEVNGAFASEYTQLGRDGGDNLTGINVDPGKTEFNPQRDLPQLKGTQTKDPNFRNRIIGDVRVDMDLAGLERVMGDRISLRADEGEPFTIGAIFSMGDLSVMHALERTKIQLGPQGRYGKRSLVHSGPTPFDNTTISGSGLELGDESVLFRSRVGNGVKIGARSYVQQCDLADGFVVPPNTVMVENRVAGTVEW